MTIAATLEIRDRFDAAQIQVSLAEADGGRRDAAPTAFALELSAEERATLDAYSAEYRRPTPGAVARVEAVEEVMRNLGRLLFETVFGAGNQGRALLDEVMGREERAEVAIVSPRPEFLSLPWELMNDPNLGYFIPNGLAGVVRQASTDIANRRD